jgi:hypothetical protein
MGGVSEIWQLRVLKAFQYTQRLKEDASKRSMVMTQPVSEKRRSEGVNMLFLALRCLRE